MGVLNQSLQYKSSGFLFIFFILNLFIQISCKGNYVLCPDQTSACANNQLCCQKGTGYRCCPDYLICCKDGTYCCTPNEFSQPLDYGLISRDFISENGIGKESEESIAIEKIADTKCPDYLLKSLINPLKDHLINQNNTPNFSLISGIKFLHEFSEARDKIKFYCSVDITEVIDSMTKEINESSNLKHLISKGNLQYLKQDFTNTLNKLEEYFLAMSQA